MKKLFTLLVLSTGLFANHLQEVPHSFSPLEQKRLLKEYLNSSSIPHSSNTYQLKKGWNKFTTPKDGIDTLKSFKDASKIKYVITYDKISQQWAAYSPNEKNKEDNILFLKYLEPNVTFFILSKEETKVETHGKEINELCLKAINSSNVKTLLSSALDNGFTFNENKNMSLKTRYFSHLKKGIYDDTRLLLIYREEPSSGKATYRYGPAQPKAKMVFTKEYEGKRFFMYDYKLEKCFAGVFPSPKIPPFPTLREVK